LAATVDLYLIGFGVGDSLQITVESQRALTRAGRAYALALPANLERYVRALGVAVVDLNESMRSAQSFEEGYLAAAAVVLRKVEEDPPIALLTPGNPLLSNAVARFILMKARERGLHVQVLAGVSPIDVAVSLTGLDVGTFGLQVFDARRAVLRSQAVNPAVPLLLLQVAAVGVERPGAGATDRGTAYGGLVSYLAKVYPLQHSATHLGWTKDAGFIARSFPLESLPEMSAEFRDQSTLFLDRVAPG
jgi:hypothetical protein